MNAIAVALLPFPPSLYYINTVSDVQEVTHALQSQETIQILQKWY